MSIAFLNKYLFASLLVVLAVGKEQIERDAVLPVEISMKTELQTIEAAPSFECPKGATLNADSTCTAITEEKPRKHCPKGYSMNKNGDCVKKMSAAPTQSCPNGVAKGHKCVEYLTAASSLECPKGYKTGGAGLCVPDGKHHDAKKTCPKGARLDGDVCVIFTPAKPEYVCDGDSILKGTSCQSISTAPPTCKEGFLANGEVCVKTRAVSPKASCPEGYSGRGNDCTRKISESPEYICDSGFLLQGNRCVNSESLPIEYVCKGDYNLENNKCIKVIEAEPMAKCPKDYVKNDDGCIKHHQSKPVATCPEHMELKGHKCYSEEVVAAAMVCSQGSYMQNNQCVSSTESENAWTCEKGYRLKEGVCVKHHNDKALKRCPIGFEEDGNKCISKTTASAALQCGPGEELKHDGKCVPTRTRPADVVCPHGYKMQRSKGAKAAPASSSSVCVKEKYSDGTLSCNAGFELKGKKCYAEEVVAASAECDGGLSKGGSCMNMRTTKAKPSCEKGYTLKKGSCVKKVKVEIPVVSAVDDSKYNAKADRAEAKVRKVAERENAKLAKKMGKM
eukprot:TRINITY_DN56196_c0_g1_i1.p1 TRINITY_DN56196_c0_g1~~TRINITY_DN56196_c0_g1_i1.p1  ORF type:complete len:562 (-),score=92.18 TRINITY_DN56196_c0_g1_i1:351-2036(-)